MREMWRALTTWCNRLRRSGRKGPAPAVIVVGIDLPSHRLIALAQQSGRIRILAAIDDYPWNHRTLLQGVPIHYPVEIAALATRLGVRDLVIFAHARRLIDEELRQTLLKQRLRLHEVDDQLDPAELIEQLRSS